MKLSYRPFMRSAFIMAIFFVGAHIRLSAHFGWNMFPTTATEAIADLTCIMGIVVACTLATVGRAIKEGEAV
jgi:hypothetical protein